MLPDVGDLSQHLYRNQVDDNSEEQRQSQSDHSRCYLAGEDFTARQTVGQHLLECALLLLAADSVVGEHECDEGEDHLNDECQIDCVESKKVLAGAVAAGRQAHPLRCYPSDRRYSLNLAVSNKLEASLGKREVKRCAGHGVRACRRFFESFIVSTLQAFVFRGVLGVAVAVDESIDHCEDKHECVDNDQAALLEILLQPKSS